MSPPDTQGWDGAGEAAEQATSDNHASTNMTCQNDQEEAKKRDAAGEVTTAATETLERPAKKMKRGKYISRACTSCQQRKIKCEGGDPCRQCLVKQLPCQSSAPRGAQQVRRDSRPGAGGAQDQTCYSSSESGINREVLVRLEAVERHLRLMRPPSPDPARATSLDDQLKPSAAKLQSSLETDGQTFAGEITMTPTFEDENERVEHSGSVSSAMRVDYSSPASSLHPTTTSPGDATGQKRAWFEGLLARHGVTADEQQCRYHLQVYLDEVHPMYPIIHPPALWEIFNDMWQCPGLSSSTDVTEREQLRLSLALVCFCLALGRCSISTRITDPSGIDSSGWSLHNVGMTLLGDILETSNTAIKSLHMLQALMVRVMYLFRLDANQKAARVHALAVSVAQTIGLHRQGTVESMPAYYSQMYSRIWWALYLLDRRLALESGKPYIIQDSNVDTPMPLDLSDEWMTRFATRRETMADLQHEVAAEIARDASPSCIPYVIAMVRYCRVAGKTWEVLYGVRASTASMPAMVEYVDTAIDKLLNTVPKNLQYDPEVPYEVQFSAMPQWQIKQTFLFNNCCTYLRLLIRRPLLPSSSSIYHTEEDDLESSIECASLAARILTTHQNIKDNVIKFSFALSHYVTSSAIVMVGLVSREPGSKRRYGDLIFAATQCLNEYCQKSWVSGKMIRCVSKLSRVVERVLAIDPKDTKDRPGSSTLRRDSASGHMMQHPTPPHSEDQEPRQMSYRMGTPNLFPNQLKNLPVDAGKRTQSDQGTDYYPFPNDPLSNLTERPTGNLNKLSTPWIAEPGIDRRNSWIMSDFSFETFGERFGSNDAGLSTLMENDRFDFSRSMNSMADQGSGEGRLGALGMNGVLDLDMDLVPTMMNMYSS
ncbi:hypothetical protein F66182_3775 [Fusarium sp. NRRL 66182]|nr:hypothetical protein F66182_3775 [Fusarium sp. NRRL 66182]